MQTTRNRNSRVDIWAEMNEYLVASKVDATIVANLKRLMKLPNSSNRDNFPEVVINEATYAYCSRTGKYFPTEEMAANKDGSMRGYHKDTTTLQNEARKEIAALKTEIAALASKREFDSIGELGDRMDALSAAYNSGAIYAELAEQGIDPKEALNA